MGEYIFSCQLLLNPTASSLQNFKESWLKYYGGWAKHYTGNIYIALVKVDPSAPDIELPFRCCQLIFRRQHYLDLIEVDQPFDSTTRDAGGFGSTGTN